MKNLKQTLLGLSVLATLPAISYADVIEIATFNLKEGVSYLEFAPLDKAVETQHVVKQPGFISRESAQGEDGEWLVVVHWDSIENAEASMNSFMEAKAASDFMSHIDSSSMVMKRYKK